MTKDDTRRSIGRVSLSPEAREADNVVAVFEKHYRLALATMKPEAALHTAYTAAANYLQSRGAKEGGVREVE